MPTVTDKINNQDIKNLEYLRDCLLNSTTIIQGCFVHIEQQLRFMTEAVQTYKRSLNDTG